MLPDRATRILADYDTDPLSVEEERRLVSLAQNGDTDAFQKIMQHNVRFVVQTAFSYYAIDEQLFDLEELVSEGYLGLARAIETFELESGNKLITYAVWWIRQRISNYIEKNGGIVRRPLGRRNIRMQIAPHVERIEREQHRTPTAEELEELTGISTRRISETMNEALNDASLDATLASNFGNDLTLGDTILIDETLPEEDAITQERGDLLTSCLSVLNERERRVIALYFGLDGGSYYNLTEVGKVIGLTRERIRQIRNDALKKMQKQHSWAVLT